jgi:hypothetical protein
MTLINYQAPGGGQGGVSGNYQSMNSGNNQMNANQYYSNTSSQNVNQNAQAPADKSKQGFTQAPGANNYGTNLSQPQSNLSGLESKLATSSNNVSMQISGMSGQISGNNISGNQPITYKGAAEPQQLPSQPQFSLPQGKPAPQ